MPADENGDKWAWYVFHDIVMAYLDSLALAFLTHTDEAPANPVFEATGPPAASTGIGLC